ncbi:S-layer homology domain-containing protein [bacterium]|nr:S-layer homology domain-containing protein [bacterium]
MTIKKLTVAAAIAVGIATCSLNQAMAACPCAEPLPTVTGPACPIERQLPVVTGAACPCEKPAPKCNSCQKALPDCECVKPAPCDPCETKKSDCGCDDEISCDDPAVPACALCPQTGKPNRTQMKQVYGYPQAIYGTNNYVGEPANSILSTETTISGCSAPALSSHINGAMVSSMGNITGAAAQMPCLNELPTINNGSFVERNEATMDGNNCPIDFQSSNSLEAIKKSFVPFDLTPYANQTTGAASDFTGGCMFPDVPNSHWASCDIDKLAINDVVVGYPDGKFKPNKNISRAEFATMLVKGFNLDSCGLEREGMFTDVPRSNWANAAIAKAVDENLLKGYPNGQFKPNNHVTRAEALTSIAKGMTCDIDQCKADEILSRYADGASVPGWARIPVAKSLENGALKDSPNPNMIMPNKDASRADVASMLQTVRVALGYDTNPKTANNICPACPVDKKVFAQEEEIVKIPTMRLEMIDQITAKSSHVGQYFRANTLEDVTINGVTYPCGSTVTGQVVEVVRPSGCDKGALKLAFTDIKNGDCKTKLPKQILSAQINKSKNVNPVARLVEMPFTWAGSLVGVVGRTAGGILTNVGNAAENVSNDAGYMLGHVFQGKFGAAARNLGDGIWETVKAPVDVTRTALSGTMGLFQTTGDEFAYLVDPRGYKISAVNPREHVTIAFGCNE